MTDLVPVTPETQFSDIPFTRSASGHVHSPFWTYDWRQYDKGTSPYTIGSRFHEIRRMAMFAFANALGLREADVFCSQRENKETGEMEWRLGTVHPCELPKRPALDQADRMRAIEKLVGDVEKPGDGVIDI